MSLQQHNLSQHGAHSFNAVCGLVCRFGMPSETDTRGYLLIAKLEDID